MPIPLRFLCSVGLLLLLPSLAACGYSEEQKASGEHCHTQLYSLKQAIKEELNDPDSFKPYRDTLWVSPVRVAGPEWGESAGTKIHIVEMEFGARNAMGGMVKAKAHGILVHDNCNAVVTRITSS